MTKLTWDNAALMSPTTAEELGISYVHGSSARSATAASTAHALVDVVELTYRGRRSRPRSGFMPGHADGAVTVHLGYGRSMPAASAEGRRLQRLRAAHLGRPVVRQRPEVRKAGRGARAGLHAEAPQHGGPRVPSARPRWSTSRATRASPTI